MIERFADPEGMSSLLNEIQMSGERDMEQIQRAAEAEATSGALDTSKLGLEVGGDTASMLFNLDSGTAVARNDGDPHLYIGSRNKTNKSYHRNAAYPLEGHRPGAWRETPMSMRDHREMRRVFENDLRRGDYFINRN